ncbi:response regulator [Kordia algicida OT-1]|uniref:dolichyl-phosphate beta-glucosyltransferase n=1 Tax=Kordia algicida OT-1 TaxID=391587 RepID=A9DR07_9FLAO|nr:response regulator [Kordia algicida]EDP96723.1 glycosyl transferase, family 2 [Kordia algicida OT-1]
MKILAIDDQKLVLIPLESRLAELGYEVLTETDGLKGKELYDSFQPDLVIVDMNMPTISGMEIVQYIRDDKQKNTPIMILSGNTDDEMITKGFDLGVNDYMKKPLSLNEVCARVKRLIGVPKTEAVSNTNNVMIQQRCVGVVIPCYNEAERLLSKEFTDFVDRNSGYRLCFVNDGSKDATLEVLHDLRKGREDFITVYDCEQNGGKAEAVRLGMLHMAQQEDLDYIGFLDADLSTDLADFDDLVSTIENSDFKIVSGSRISRMGANITKESARKVISLTINLIIRTILSMNFKDTQCGAKIFHKDVIHLAFDKKFITKWLFDVEIFMRMRKHFGLDAARAMMCEKPLKRWIHADGSKLSMKDSIKIIGQLGQIAWYYNRKRKTATKANLELI